MIALFDSYEVTQGGAFIHKSQDVADDRKAQLICHEFLNNLAGNARSEPEEILLEPFHWNLHQTGPMLQRLANQLDGIAVSLGPYSNLACKESLCGSAINVQSKTAGP